MFLSHRVEHVGHNVGFLALALPCILGEHTLEVVVLAGECIVVAVGWGQAALQAREHMPVVAVLAVERIAVVVAGGQEEQAVEHTFGV